MSKRAAPQAGKENTAPKTKKVSKEDKEAKVQAAALQSLYADAITVGGKQVPVCTALALSQNAETVKMRNLLKYKASDKCKKAVGLFVYCLPL